MNSLDLTSSAVYFALNKKREEAENSVASFIAVTAANACFGVMLVVSIVGIINQKKRVTNRATTKLGDKIGGEK